MTPMVMRPLDDPIAEQIHDGSRRRDDTAGGCHLSNVQSHYFLRGEHTGGAFSLLTDRLILKSRRAARWYSYR